ncbi:MAG: DUF4860 domain-containing protein [Clostridia bacterium]|nr:DUF4860 domain-containing protein [Clostridia bacterium]
MKRTTSSSHAISGVFVFLLLGIFAVFSTVMVLLSARAYKGAVDRLAAHNAARIAPAYLRSMVRADDEMDVVFVEEKAGVTSVTLRNVYDGEAYVTRMYCWEGMLCEWFSEEASEFIPAEGESVCACEALTAQTLPGLLSVRLQLNDQWTQVDIALRAGR